LSCRPVSQRNQAQADQDQNPGDGERQALRRANALEAAGANQIDAEESDGGREAQENKTNA
jgi:hypothetical protein